MELPKKSASSKREVDTSNSDYHIYAASQQSLCRGFNPVRWRNRIFT